MTSKFYKQVLCASSMWFVLHNIKQKN